MTNILILGANGQIARVATNLFLARTGVHADTLLEECPAAKFSAPPTACEWWKAMS